MFTIVVYIIMAIIVLALLIPQIWKSETKGVFTKPFAFKILDDGDGLEIGIFWIAVFSIIVCS